MRTWGAAASMAVMTVALLGVAAAPALWQRGPGSWLAGGTASRVPGRLPARAGWAQSGDSPGSATRAIRRGGLGADRRSSHPVRIGPFAGYQRMSCAIAANHTRSAESYRYARSRQGPVGMDVPQWEARRAGRPPTYAGCAEFSVVLG
jgi:hypothetical protein